MINADIGREGETFLASSVELQTHAHHVSMAIWEVKIIQRLVCKCSGLVKLFSATALMYGIHAFISTRLIDCGALGTHGL